MTQPLPSTYDKVVPTITFVFTRMGRTGICRMRWREGWSVHRYLREQPLRSHALLGMWKKCKARNQHQQKIRLTYIPAPGDAVVLSRARAT